MQLISKKLPKTHKIFFASDFHEGTIMKHKHGVQRFIKHVLSDKNNHVVIGGDLAEAIMIDDKRYSADTVDKQTSVPLLQYQAVVKELLPIKDRLITILEGNHDAKLARYGNFVRDYVCKELGVPYGTYSSKVTIKDLKGNNQYKIFVTHGSRNISSTADDPIRRESNMKLSLKRILSDKAGDCILQCQGHSHKLLVADPLSKLYLTDNEIEIRSNYTASLHNGDNYIHPDHRYFISSGSFLKLYGDMGVSGYAEIFGYDPVELGYVVANIENGIVKAVDKVVL